MPGTEPGLDCPLPVPVGENSLSATCLTVRGPTRYALAKRAGISRVYVTKLETGRSDPTIGMLTKLAKALGVPVAELLGRYSGQPTDVKAEEMRRRDTPMKMSRKMEAALRQAVRPGVRVYVVHKVPGAAAARIRVGNEGTLRLDGRAVRGRVVAKDRDVLLFQTKKAVRRKRAKHPLSLATARKRVAPRKKRKAKKRAK